MLTCLAKLIAHSLFALRRSGASVLSLIVVTTVATAFATVGAATLLDGRRVPTEVSDASALGTFISANGTTSTEWQIAGPSGPGFVDDAGALDILPNVSLAGAPGTGALQMGQMTGSTTLPTGALSWTAAAGKALTCSAKASSSLNTTTGTMTVDGPTVSLGPTTATVVNIGNNATKDPTINIGDQTAASGQTISIGGGAVTLGAGTGQTATWTPTELVFAFSRISSLNFGGGLLTLTGAIININGQQANTPTSPLACGTGGTISIPAESAMPITTGTLASDCVLDFSANGQSGWTVFLDMSGVTVNASFGIVFKNGTVSVRYVSTSIFSGTLATVVTINPTNSLAVNW